MFRAMFAATLLAAPAAHAWEVVAQVSIRMFAETSVYALGASSKASTDGSTHGGRSEPTEEQAAAAPGRPGEPRDDDPPPPPPAPEQSPSEPGPEPKREPLRPRGREPQPAAPPAASEERPMMLWRKSTELYLREHASQLKQDVALGDGPVVSALAAMQVLPPARLGKLLRANHTELLALIGDPGDTEWPERFLKRVVVLHSRQRDT